MAFFPRSYINESNSSFSPLFRFLDDFDNYQNVNNRHHHRNGVTKSATFSPKFDVKELADTYELHGELPGIEQKDIEIEFADDHTLTIKGHTEHSHTSGTPPSGFLEGSKSGGAITEKGEGASHKATVEDEDAAQSTEVAKTTPASKNEEKPEVPEAKFWVSERSVGEFSRSFSFPVRVDLENVKASMKNGILSIVVPKSKKHEARKITIN